MSVFRSYSLLFILALIGLLSLFFIGLVSGDIETQFSDVYNALFNYSELEMNQVIVREIRLPRVVMAILAGAALSLAGMLMQTLFQNPLAGPYVLGINSGSSLMVALGMLSGIGFFSSELGVIGSALAGAFLLGIFILFSSFFIRNQISLLLFGVMLGSFVMALISILEVSSHASSLKAFTLWSMGSLDGVLTHQLPGIALVFSVGCVLSFLIVKPLNVLALGEEECRLMGYNIQFLRISIIFVTALFAGLITAYCGPIAFVGLAIPNLTRMLFRTQDHFVLTAANLLYGALFLLSCVVLIQQISDYLVVPINALTSLVGAPFVIYILIRKIR